MISTRPKISKIHVYVLHNISINACITSTPCTKIIMKSNPENEIIINRLVIKFYNLMNTKYTLNNELTYLIINIHNE